MTARFRPSRHHALAALGWRVVAAGGIVMIVPVATMLAASFSGC